MTFCPVSGAVGFPTSRREGLAASFINRFGNPQRWDGPFEESRSLACPKGNTLPVRQRRSPFRLASVRISVLRMVLDGFESRLVVR